MDGQGLWRAARLATMLALAAAPAAAQQSGGSGLGGPGVVGLSLALETQVVDSVVVEVRDGSGARLPDRRLAGAALRAFGLRPGDRLALAAVEAGLARVRLLEGVEEAESRFVPIGGDGARTRAVLSVTMGAAPQAARPAGMLAGGGAGAFPILWKSRDSGLVRFILGGGLGAFSDGNPWFGNAPAFTTGNPLVQDPAQGAGTGRRATWAESWIEFGLAGVGRLGDSNLAFYGAATGIAVASRGRDIFRDDPRQSLTLERAYLGLLWGSQDGRSSANLSFGRLNFSLNGGFLVSQFGSQWNAGPRPGIYLAPRTTHDLAAVGTFRQGQWTATAFYLDPNEYEPLSSDTRLAGFNLRWTFDERFHADGTVLKVLESTTGYGAPSGRIGTRDGLTTYAAHVRWADRERAPGLWLESEVAHQRHPDFAMDAWAGYATVGYLALDAPWTPSLSYRFSAFTGDDPDTARYERFDALYSGGLSEWLQGVSLGKLVRPENRISHRVRLNLAPDPRLNLTLDWYLHRADELNNIGANPAIGQLSSHDLGQELQVVARWAISDNLYFLGVASRAFPGKALRAAAGGEADDWTTLQAQLFWTF